MSGNEMDHEREEWKDERLTSKPWLGARPVSGAEAEVKERAPFFMGRTAAGGAIVERRVPVAEKWSG